MNNEMPTGLPEIAPPMMPAAAPEAVAIPAGWYRYNKVGLLWENTVYGTWLDPTRYGLPRVYEGYSLEIASAPVTAAPGIALLALNDASTKLSTTIRPLNDFEEKDGAWVSTGNPSLIGDQWITQQAVGPDVGKFNWHYRHRNAPLHSVSAIGRSDTLSEAVAAVNAHHREFFEQFLVTSPKGGSGAAAVALKVAYRHLDMGAMRISHCKDAALIDAAMHAAGVV